MKTLTKSILLCIVCLLFVTCGKEELTFNPAVNPDSSFGDLQEINSFFDRKETTFIITEEEYERLISDRTDSTFTFKNDDIFSDFNQYTHISYPYFAETPELFFMGRITNLNVSNNEVQFDIAKCTYEDLYEDYLINTSLPNGYATVREECGKNQVSLAQANSEFQSALNGVLDILASTLSEAIKEEMANTFLQDGVLNIQNVGTMTGCVNLIITPKYSGFEIKDFSLNGYGIQMSFGDQEVDFDKLKTNLQTEPKPILKEYEDQLVKMLNPFEGSFTTDSKNVSKATFVAPGLRTNFLGGVDLTINGDFLFNSLGIVSTSQSIDIRVEKLNNDLVPTVFINNSASLSLSDFLLFSGDLYMGAQAELTAELLGGISISDNAGLLELGFLIGYESSTSVEGQIGNLVESNGSSKNYLQGCASYTESINSYVFGESSIINTFIEAPNVIPVGSNTTYDVSQDPNFQKPSNSISYTKICFPDNCKSILDGTSYVKLLSAANGTFDFEYFVASSEVAPQGFKIEVIQGDNSVTIVENGTYGNSDAVSTTIIGPLAVSLNSDILSNINVRITDKFNDCSKSISLLKLNESCNSDYIDPISGLQLRRYNIDVSVSEDFSEDCNSSTDPVWVYSEQSLITLYGYNEGYESIDYMSKDACECYAEKLSTNNVVYKVPSFDQMFSFMESNEDKDMSMIQGGNQFCTNFTPSGYITLGGAVCSNIWNLSSPNVALTTQYCIKDFDNAYFHIDIGTADPLNDHLFVVDNNGQMRIEDAPKGILAPCRLQIIN